MKRMAANPLKVVPDVPEPVIDITMLLRREIIVRDWKAVHVRADRSQPVELLDRPKRGRWR